MITLGGIALAFGLIRVFWFKIPESPAYLLSKGRDADAVEAVNYICRYNGRPETMTLEMLQYIDQQEQVGHVDVQPDENIAAIATATATAMAETGPRSLSHLEILRESFRDYSAKNYRKLFASRKMAQHSSVTFLIWLTVGIAYPLYFAFITSYLETKSSYSAVSSLNYTYMIYCIVSVVGVMGPIAAGFAVETRFGRRWMMAASAVLTGVFLFAYTTVETGAADVGFQCATAILGNFGMGISHLNNVCITTCKQLWTNLGNYIRVCHHVCLHARVVSRPNTRYGYRNGIHASQARRSGGLVHLNLRRLHGSAHLRERQPVDTRRHFLLGPTL